MTEMLAAPDHLDAAPTSDVQVGRNARVAAVAAGFTGLITAAYLVRAAGQGAALDWVVALVLVVVTLAHLRALRDSRTPILVADGHGVRIRLGNTWRGMPWSAIDEVEHQPRRGWLRDGRLVIFPRDLEGALVGVSASGRRSAGLNSRLYGAPLAVPLGLTTSVVGAEGDLSAVLARLAEGRCTIVTVVPGLAEEDATETTEAIEITDEIAEGEHAPVNGPDAGPDAGPVASPTPSPLREPTRAIRVELLREPEPDSDAGEDTVALDRSHLLEPESTGTWHAATEVIDDLADVPIIDPVIGPQLKAARERLRLSIDQLSERTRIRPHVLEALEIDDFVPCGGDFYARGHLRTLARVLGLDVAPLLATYAERYAEAPIDPRRVFEAELAGARGGIRDTRGGPNWSVLVAAVMAVVLVWSIARLVMDSGANITPATPSLANGSAGLSSGGQLAPAVPVLLTAAGGGAHVVVRDGAGRVVFKDSIAFGATQALEVSPPVRIQSSDGSLEVTVDGQVLGALGETGHAAQDVFTAR